MSEINAKSVFKEYDKMKQYKESINLYNTVKVNENFFVGKQWEGVEANGLPTPVFNFIKRVLLFTVASNTSEKIKLRAAPLSAKTGVQEIEDAVAVINDQFEALFEHNDIPALIREYMRNAGVDGDSAMFTYWDSDVDAGDGKTGAIKTELIMNTRVGFGNPADRRVQTQPYILVAKHEFTETLKKRAKKYGTADLDRIVPDDSGESLDSYKELSDKTTVVTRFWKDDKTKTVWAIECTKDEIIRPKWDMGLKLYPLTWLSWDYIQDSYHGQAMVTGLIPNQIFINKLFAMTMLSLMTSAYPKVVYDKTRISKWNNQIGTAIGVNGGDINSVARILDPAHISPQVHQFITLALDMTQSSLGATAVALGDARPDNTSAIIALQRAAATPNELTRQNLYKSIRELGHIYIDFMANYYGTREVKLPVNQEMAEFAEVPLDEEGRATKQYDFSQLKDIPVMLRQVVGASAYWSEIASSQTLDNLLNQGHIDVVDYLERIPDDYITDRQSLLNKKKESMGMNAQVAPAENITEGQEFEEAEFAGIPTRGGKGNGELQRKLHEFL